LYGTEFLLCLRGSAAETLSVYLVASLTVGESIQVSESITHTHLQGHQMTAGGL